MFGLHRPVIAGALIATGLLQTPLRAAEPRMPGFPLDAEPAVPPIVVTVPIDPRTGRCLAGFVRDPLAACVRHDEPRIVCDAPAPIPAACHAAAPSPTPYGLGPNRRLDY